ALHLRRENGALTGTVDSPDQGGIGVPMANVTAAGGRLAFDVPQARAHYAGTWDSAQRAYVGAFTAAGGGGTMRFVRGALPAPPPVDWSAPMAPGFAYTPGPAARARTGPALPVGKCINVSDALEAPAEGDWAPRIRDDDFRIIRAAGFRTVRIPVRWSAHAGETPPYAIDPVFLARVHHVVGLAIASGLNVILNVHHYAGLDEAPEANAPRFAALWRQIAASFARAPASVWFELDNEPHDKFTNANLLSVLEPALAAVRATNRTRPVLIGGENWSGIGSLATLPMPDDPYVVPTFHYYDPMAFTHQGAAWAAPHPPPIGRAYGSAADKAELDADLRKVRDYMARTGRVPILGEYGAQDDPRVPVEQRIRYYHAISTAFASIGVQSCAWGYRAGFKLRDGDHWVPGLVESIATTTTR
ncbi:MAG TPA: glycoside hydrolase family 5 protein, partial [Allosphingosinicella sp.]|nr:glycoside hydrolase family 5 protein [Allosphingosinicella sp.]